MTVSVQAATIAYPRWPASFHYWREGDYIPEVHTVPRGVTHITIPTALLLKLLASAKPPVTIIDPSMT